MNYHPKAAAGFGERGREPLENIPTDTEGFLLWVTKLDRHHPYKYELSNGKVSRVMIHVTRGHRRVATNILGELLQKLDRTRFEAGNAEFGVNTGVGMRVQTHARVIALGGCEIQLSMAAMFRDIPDLPAIE